MRILLVNPWITDFAAYDLWAKPLGLLYAGAFLAARGHEVRLVDCMHRFQGPEGYIGGEIRPCGTGKFHREVIPKPSCLVHVPRYYCRYGIPAELFREMVMGGPEPDVALVTSIMTYWYPGAFEAIARLREMLPDTPVALGGVYSLLCTGHARARSGADRVIAETLPTRIVEAVESLAGKSGDGPLPADVFGRWPEPAWDLYGRLPAAVAMTSRGCPMHCTACASRLLSDTFERRTPQAAASAVLALASRGVRDIAFYDDALLLDADRYAAPLFAELGEANAGVRLHTPNGLHVREITPELASLMRRAGMVTVRLSLETASEDRAREQYSGKVSREHFRRAVEALYAAGFSPEDLGAYVLAGLPGQEPEEVYETVAFSHSRGVKVRPALFSPVPGTVEFGRAVETSLIGPDDDPLLQNNTLRILDIWGGGKAYERFRRMVTEGNARI
jgi:hypothetical protein